MFTPPARLTHMVLQYLLPEPRGIGNVPEDRREDVKNAFDQASTRVIERFVRNGKWFSEARKDPTIETLQQLMVSRIDDALKAERKKLLEDIYVINLRIEFDSFSKAKKRRIAPFLEKHDAKLDALRGLSSAGKSPDPVLLTYRTWIYSHLLTDPTVPVEDIPAFLHDLAALYHERHKPAVKEALGKDRNVNNMSPARLKNIRQILHEDPEEEERCARLYKTAMLGGAPCLYKKALPPRLNKLTGEMEEQSWVLIHLKDEALAREFGEHTALCTARGLFDAYATDLWMVISPTQRVQISLAHSQIRDKHDLPVSFEELDETFQDFIDAMLEVLKQRPGSNINILLHSTYIRKQSGFSEFIIDYFNDVRRHKLSKRIDALETIMPYIDMHGQEWFAASMRNVVNAGMKEGYNSQLAGFFTRVLMRPEIASPAIFLSMVNKFVNQGQHTRIVKQALMSRQIVTDHGLALVPVRP